MNLELLRSALIQGKKFDHAVAIARGVRDPESEPPPIERKIVQISESCGDGGDWSLTALCDDGTLWLRASRVWRQIPPIPQGDES